MTSKLYIMLRSPEEHCDLEVIDRLSGEEGRAAMLFEDAVYFSVMEKRGKNLLDRVDRAYVISDDLRSRGIASHLMEGFEEVDYPKAVDLIMEEYGQTVTI
ncbi:MAG: DsrH/TusB family sulfur metabolism protein [Methanomassiliicoccales archaeon]